METRSMSSLIEAGGFHTPRKTKERISKSTKRVGGQKQVNVNPEQDKENTPVKSTGKVNVNPEQDKENTPVKSIGKELPANEKHGISSSKIPRPISSTKELSITKTKDLKDDQKPIENIKTNVNIKKNTNIKKNENIKKKIPDFSKLHKVWDKKLQQGKAVTKKPLTQIQPFNLTKGTSGSTTGRKKVIKQTATELFPADGNLNESFEEDEEAKRAILYGLNRDDLHDRRKERVTIAVLSKSLSYRNEALQNTAIQPQRASFNVVNRRTRDIDDKATQKIINKKKSFKERNQIPATTPTKIQISEHKQNAPQKKKVGFVQDFHVDFKSDPIALQSILESPFGESKPRATQRSMFGPVKRATFAAHPRTSPYNKTQDPYQRKHTSFCVGNRNKSRTFEECVLSILGPKRSSQISSQINTSTAVSRHSINEKGFNRTLVGYQDDMDPDPKPFNRLSFMSKTTATGKRNENETAYQSHVKSTVQNSNIPKPQISPSVQHKKAPNRLSSFCNPTSIRDSIYQRNIKFKNDLQSKSPMAFPHATVPDFMKTPQRKTPKRPMPARDAMDRVPPSSNHSPPNDISKPKLADSTAVQQNGNPSRGSIYCNPTSSRNSIYQRDISKYTLLKVRGLTPPNTDSARTPVQLSTYVPINDKPFSKENKCERLFMDNRGLNVSYINLPENPRNDIVTSTNQNLCWAELLNKEENIGEIKIDGRGKSHTLQEPKAVTSQNEFKMKQTQPSDSDKQPKIEKPYDIYYPSICSHILHNIQNKSFGEKMPLRSAHDVITSKSHEQTHQNSSMQDRVIISPMSRQKRHNHQSIIQSKNVKTYDIIGHDRENFEEQSHRHTDNKPPTVALTNVQLSRTTSTNIIGSYGIRNNESHYQNSQSTYNSINSKMYVPETTITNTIGANTILTQSYQHPRMHPSPYQQHTQVHVSPQVPPHARQLPKPLLNDFMGHPSNTVSSPFRNLLLATPSAVKPEIQQQSKPWLNIHTVYSPIPIRANISNNISFTTPAREDQSQLISPMCPTARRTWARTPHAKETSKSAFEKNDDSDDNTILSFTIPTNTKEVDDKNSVKLNNETTTKTDNNLSIGSLSVVKDSNLKIGHLGQASAFRRVAATCNVLPRNTVWTSFPKSRIEKPKIHETFPDALLDAEVAVYSSLLEISKRMGGIGEERRFLPDPVSKILTEGDSMHFVPIHEE